ncbi:MAG: helix-turn-helix transcriptional regulator [Patescibacteria group bacterium]
MQEVVHNSVHDLRKEKQVTQEDLARAVGVTRQTIIAVERGNYTPSVCLALKIADYFNMHVEDIFYIETK